MRTCTRCSVLVAAVAGAMGITTRVCAGDVPPTFDRIALRGDAAPGLAPGYRYAGLYDPSINDAGQVLFEADLLDPQGAFVLGGNLFLRSDAGQTTVVARPGTPAPGTDTNHVDFLSHYVADDGRVTFTGGLPGGSPRGDPPQYGAWIGRPGDIRLIARTGQQPPGLPSDAKYTYTTNPPVIVGERILFNALYEQPGTSLNEGVWAGPPESLNPVMLRWQQAPDLPGQSIDLMRGYAMTDNGAVFVAADTTGSGAPAGVWRYTPETGTRLVLRGGQAPAPDGAGTFRDFELGGVDDTERVILHASLFGGKSGIFQGPVDALWTVALSGQSPPGTGNLVWRGFSRPIAHESGALAFHGFLNNPDGTDARTGVWVGPGTGELDLVAREGQPAPGADSFVFGPFNLIHNAATPDINAHGQVLLYNHLRSTTGSSERGSLWLSDSDGVPHLLAQEGALFDIDPGAGETLRRVSFVGVTNDSLNDLGQAVFSLRFADGSSGIFTATIPPVPEPAAMIPAALGLLVLRRRRRR